MPDWMIAIAGVAGIFLIGLIFSAVDLIKDVAKTVFISLFVFIVILLANRYLTPSATEQSYTNSYPPNSYSFTEPPPAGSPGADWSNPNFSSPGSDGSGYPYSNDSQVAPPTTGTEPSIDGNDITSRASEYFNNLTEDIREFVFGSPQYRSSSQPGTTPDRDLIYVLPPDSSSQESQPGSIASQPSNPSFNQPATSAPSQSFQPPAPEQRARSSAGTSTTRPVPAMW